MRNMRAPYVTRLLEIAAIVGGSALAVRVWKRRWDATPQEVQMLMPGDELIPEASTVETRAISIDAAPEEFWPWLVQMGYGRAGWYSYDKLDMKGVSADRITPEWQELNSGDIMPTHAEGGFKVASLDSARSLVLYMDDRLAREQRMAAQSRKAEPMTPGLQLSSEFLERSMPAAFRVSWSFFLKPEGLHRTRLIQRVRLQGSQNTVGMILGPLLGFGVFLMQRKQMLGIKRRAEGQHAAAREGRLRALVRESRAKRSVAKWE
jgi:hypothetical protein